MPLHFYIGWSLLPDFLMPVQFVLAGVLVLTVSALLIPFGTFSRIFINDQVVIDRLVWAGSLMMGWFSSLLIFTILRDIVLFVPGFQAWSTESAYSVLALSITVSFVGFFNARRLAKVVHVDIPLSNLSPDLGGLTIAQISDLHIGSTIKAGYVRNIVRRVNELDADIIAITGDVVDGKVKQLVEEAAPLADLHARYGVYIVTGNHEYYSGADDWMDTFRQMGMITLMNEHVVIEHKGAGLVLAGVNDYSVSRIDETQSSDPWKAISGSPDNIPKILLAHQPRSATAAVEVGFDLQLSGHTHGGQFWPWNHFVRMQQPYTAGLHRLGQLWIYTSRGTGYWGPPKRFGAPSEITFLRLQGVQHS